ncbi:hypothetical protein Dfulv_10530 [Dactylosporangium fulvum]|uniref:Cytochrome P450 n=1 Tax=Dactylosporangium fulvum TaxID=53359 RepID=A0ABY5W5M7_9ACTN|nr:hypothetical protein [Dactylosporangium fulvum]UWP84636.1 hypothetical protein Dfulv_10530 [Dactylosporangium fulvum]
MNEITDPGVVRAVLADPSFAVPPVPSGDTGIAWLRATVSRFSTGAVHARRRALVEGLLAGIDPADLAAAPPAHPVATLAAVLGAPPSIVDDVRTVAAAYQPGTGDEEPADGAVERLVAAFGGAHDEPTAARIGLLVQACDATATLIERARTRPVADVLRDAPPVVATRRQALAAATVAGVPVAAGEVVRLSLAADPFGAGPRACPGRAHALALVEGVLR